MKPGAAFALIGLGLLSACSGEEAPAVAEGAEHVACALAKAQAFAMDCAVERTTVGAEQVLVLHHPDGGFRRLSVRQDGAGVSATDGADAARVTVSGDQLDVSIGDDRYRIPFTVKARGGD